MKHANFSIEPLKQMDNQIFCENYIDIYQIQTIIKNENHYQLNKLETKNIERVIPTINPEEFIKWVLLTFIF